ncbi:MAG TPA: hypothetical protein DCF33_22055 [Saprospirales bacterium]|nr:hypothetical protein [Saprospirales bacterium]
MNIKWRHFRFLFTELQRPLDLEITYDELADFDLRFRLILRKHLVILGWWSLLNIGGGVVALFFLTGTVYYYFWMMGMIWGLINFIIVMAILDHTFYRKFRRGAFERFESQRHVEKLMFLNIGIDSAYVFVGLFLREHSFACEVEHATMWLGFGWSVIIQGLFLLIQDIMVYRLHRKNFRKAQPFLEKLLGN